MKFTAHIAITAVVILAAAAGVLVPLRANIEQSQKDVEVLESERLHDASTSVQLEDVKRKSAEFQQQHEGRTYDLCPDTPADARTARMWKSCVSTGAEAFWPYVCIGTVPIVTKTFALRSMPISFTACLC